MRAILATSLIFFLAAAPAAQAAPDIVVKPDRKPKVKIFLSEHANRADINDRDYVVRNAQGPRVVNVPSGFSLSRILEIAKVGTVKGYVEIAGEGVVLLDRPNMRSSPYTDGPPAIFEDEDGRITFLRPERKDGEPYNAKDVFTAGTGPLLITEHDEQLLDLKIKASETKIDPGDSVDFTAELTQPSGSNDEVEWTAQGRGDKTGESATYVFPDAGNFAVSATVTDGYDRRGEDTVEIQVGEPRPSDENQDGGGLNNNPYAPDTGAYTGPTGANFPDPSATGGRGSAADPLKVPDPGAAGVEVAGELLSETGVYLPPAPEELLGVRSGTPDEGTNWTVPGIALGATLVVGLLGFGAGREFEQLHRERLRRLLPI